jgi:hypothetical protein
MECIISREAMKRFENFPALREGVKKKLVGCGSTTI